MFLRINKRNFSLTILIAIIFFDLSVVYSRFIGDLPVGVDSSSHLFKVLYLSKTYTSYGYIPSWCSDWYGGTPFLRFYPPLAYLLTFFFTFLKIEPVIAYKIVEAFFYILAPISVYFLSHELGFKKSESIFAGVFFSLTPIVIENFTFYDRFTTIISVPFLCLFLISFRKALRLKKFSPLLVSSFLLSIIILIHHLTAYYLVIVILLVAAVYYLKTRDAKNIFKRTVFIVIFSILLTAFWIFPFLSSVFTVNNPFYNESVFDNFIALRAFKSIILSLGLLQLVFAVLEITLHMYPFMWEIKNLKKLFRLFFPPISIIVGAIVNHWAGEAGQFLVILGFVAFFGSFLGRMKKRAVEEAEFIICVLWFLVFLWLGLGYNALLIRILPFFKNLDTLRFLFYSAIPLSVLAGKFLGRLSSSVFPNVSSLKIRSAISRSTVLVSCLIFVLATNLYFYFTPLGSFAIEMDYLSTIRETSIPRK